MSRRSGMTSGLRRRGAAALVGGEKTGGKEGEDDPERSEEALAAAWRDLGSFLREAASPGEAVVVCGNPDASRGLRMRASRKWPLTAGGADVRILHYDVLPPLEAAAAAAVSGRSDPKERRGNP